MIKKWVSLESWAKFLFCVALLVSGYFCFNSLSQPILEAYGFRQTQTALTTYYFIQNGFSLAYWTPVVGQPWSIPFEFPIYQELVALGVKLLQTPLTETGRVVSWILTVLLCWPIALVLREFGCDKKTGYFVSALFLSSPLYLFWASTFMIESAALFFVMFFAFYAIKIAKRTEGLAVYIFAGLFLTLGLLQKSTTGLPVVFIFGLVFCFGIFKMADVGGNKKYLVKVGLALGLSVLIAYLWVFYTDALKMHNPIAVSLTSDAVKPFLVGTFKQRFSSALWEGVIWKRIIQQNMFTVIGLFTLVLGLIFASNRRLRLAIGLLLIVGFAPFFIFTNLHIVHLYYPTANLAFLLMALGIAAIAVGDKFLKTKPLVYVIFLSSFLIYNFYHFSLDYRALKIAKITTENNQTLRMSAYIKAHTQPEDTVIWYGFNWSSEAAFYSERKSLTVPDWGTLNEDVINKTQNYLSAPAAAIVLCPDVNAAKIKAAIRGKYPMIKPTQVGTCEVYFTQSLQIPQER